MKTLAVILILLLLNTSVFSNDKTKQTNEVEKSTANIENINKHEKESLLNQVGVDFIDLLLKKDEKKAYDFLHPLLQEKLSYNHYLELNGCIPRISHLVKILKSIT